jgi:hypothetical protein
MNYIRGLHHAWAKNNRITLIMDGDNTIWLNRSETKKVLAAIAKTHPELLLDVMETRTINLIAEKING